jgi:aryl-alcohol dehydrogenase-like predicted oxidoreductase
LDYRRLGRTGLKVAQLCLGGMNFGDTCDEATSFAIMDAYVEAGGNFIDTADIYSRWAEGNPGGVSEEIIGRWMKARGNRAGLVIATKVRGAMGEGPNDQGLSRRHIMEAVEASLHRLQTDYIDLYQAHSDDRETPLDETLGAFDDLVRQGKVRYIGASNYAAWRLTRALWESDRHGYARYDSLQPHYNLAYRDEFERELEPLCLEQGLGVIPYSPLAAGFLTGKYRRGRELPRSRRVEGIKRRYLNERGFALLDEIDKVATAHDATTAQVALAWLLARPSITAPIIGANSVQQLRETLAAGDLRLDPEAVTALDAASDWRTSR